MNRSANAKQHGLPALKRAVIAPICDRVKTPSRLAEPLHQRNVPRGARGARVHGHDDQSTAVVLCQGKPSDEGVKHTVNAAMPCPESGKTGNSSDSLIKLQSKPLGDFLGHLLRVAERHHGVVAIEQRIVDAGIAGRQRPLVEDDRPCLPHLQDRHAVDR